jgi:hypothetical protein
MESNIPHATGLVYVAILLVVFVGAVYGWAKYCADPFERICEYVWRGFCDSIWTYSKM